VKWRYAHTRVAGTSHEARGIPCQDACYGDVLSPSAEGTVFLGVVADGAGSAARAEIGAELACDLLVKELKHFYSVGKELSDLRANGGGVPWLEAITEGLRIRAEAEGHSVADFACTLLVAVVEPKIAAFLQVGDGAIVVRVAPDSDYEWVFWPQKGAYANETCFVTSHDVVSLMAFEVREQRISELALFTDGIETLTLHFSTRTVHGPFFDPIFERLRKEPAGHSKLMSDGVAAFLASEPVNERTDDDKTLIVATRAPHDLG
jgi:hypothetical protein